MKMRVIIISLWDVDTPSVFCHNRFSTFFFSFFFLSNTFLSPACFFAIGPSCPFLLVSSSIPAVSFKLLGKECDKCMKIYCFKATFIALYHDLAKYNECTNVQVYNLKLFKDFSNACLQIWYVYVSQKYIYI